MHAAEQLRFDTAAVETELTETWVNEGAGKMITVESELVESSSYRSGVKHPIKAQRAQQEWGWKARA